eukprot:TRINITY_DN3542_c0_g1_i1.p1 TRINITY_DN3542_c0_g1~~TRINITY_DN3542_c0_g1_i1.p1  ORF type:complete len:660 (-),score=112.30 TRINITY_DN3542_c0_g1_i1:102-2006(-)
MTMMVMTPRTVDSYSSYPTTPSNGASTLGSGGGSQLLVARALPANAPERYRNPGASKFRRLVMRVGHLLAPPHELEKVFEELEQNWYDTRESLRELSDDAARCLGIPLDLAAALRAEAMEGKLLKRYTGRLPPVANAEEIESPAAVIGPPPAVAAASTSNAPGSESPGTNNRGSFGGSLDDSFHSSNHAGTAKSNGTGAGGLTDQSRTSQASPSPVKASPARRLVKALGHLMLTPSELERAAVALESNGFDTRESFRDLSDDQAAQLGVPRKLATALREEASSQRLLKRYSGPVPAGPPTQHPLMGERRSSKRGCGTSASPPPSRNSLTSQQQQQQQRSRNLALDLQHGICREHPGPKLNPHRSLVNLRNSGGEGGNNSRSPSPQQQQPQQQNSPQQTQHRSVSPGRRNVSPSRLPRSAASATAPSGTSRGVAPSASAPALLPLAPAGALMPSVQTAPSLSPTNTTRRGAATVGWQESSSPTSPASAASPAATATAAASANVVAAVAAASAAMQAAKAPGGPPNGRPHGAAAGACAGTANGLVTVQPSPVWNSGMPPPMVQESSGHSLTVPPGGLVRVAAAAGTAAPPPRLVVVRAPPSEQPGTVSSPCLAPRHAGIRPITMQHDPSLRRLVVG